MNPTAATTTQSLSVKERKMRAAKIAKDAPAKLRAGIVLIDFREATAKDRAVDEKLARRQTFPLTFGTLSQTFMRRLLAVAVNGLCGPVEK